MAATDLERLVVQIEGQTAKFEKALARMEGRSAASAKKVEKTFADMQSRMDRSFSAVGASLAGALGIGFGVKSFLDTAQALDSLDASLKAITGSQEAAAKEMAFLTTTADRLGLELMSTAGAYTGLLAATKGTALAGEPARDIFFAVANAMSTLGKSASDTEGALLAIQQMVSKGKIQAEELRGQLGERLPGAFSVAAKAAGVTEAELSKMLDDGRVGITLLPRLAEELNKLYSSDRKSTLTAEINRLSNAVTDLYKALADTGGISLATSAMREMANIVREIAMYYKLLRGGNFGEIFAVDPQAQARFALRMGMQGYNYADTEKAGQDFFKSFGGGDSAKAGNAAPPFKPLAGNPKAPDDYQREIKSIRERTEALQLETEALGKSTYEAEKAKVAHDLLNAAKDAGRKITPELVAQIDKEAEAYARAAEKAEKAKEAYAYVEEAQQVLASAFSGAVSAIRQGESAIDALANSLNRLLDQVMDMISKQLFKQLFEGFSFSSGGSVSVGSGGIGHAATGGRIAGPGSGTSDSIPTMLSNGEYVVRASMAKRYGALLEAINSGRFHLPHFATGGSVGAAPSGGGFGALSVEVVNPPGMPATARAETARGPNGQAVLRIFLDAARKDFAAGGFDPAARGRFALTPAAVRRG